MGAGLSGDKSHLSDGAIPKMSKVHVILQRHDGTVDARRCVDVEGAVEAVLDYPWEEEAVAFAKGGCPQGDPSLASVKIDKPNAHSSIVVARPCQHLIPGRTDADGFHILVTGVCSPGWIRFLMRAFGFSEDYQFWTPNLQTTAGIVQWFLAADSETFLHGVKVGMFAEYRL